MAFTECDVRRGRSRCSGCDHRVGCDPVDVGPSQAFISTYLALVATYSLRWQRLRIAQPIAVMGVTLPDASH